MFQANLWSSTAMGWRTRSPLRLTHLSTSHLRQTRKMDHWLPISAPFSGKPLPHLRLYTWHDNNYCFRVQNHADRQPYSRDGDRRKKSCSKEQFLSLILLLRHWPSEYGDSVCREGRRSEALQKADKAPNKVKRLLVKKHIGKWWASQEAKIVGVRATKHENKNLGNSRGAERKESAHSKSQKNKVEDKKGKLFCRPGDLCLNFFFISLMSECGAAEAKEDRDKRWASWKQPKKSNRWWWGNGEIETIPMIWTMWSYARWRTRSLLSTLATGLLSGMSWRKLGDYHETYWNIDDDDNADAGGNDR